jgi:hypothetical protein
MGFGDTATRSSCRAIKWPARSAEEFGDATDNELFDLGPPR